MNRIEEVPNDATATFDSKTQSVPAAITGAETQPAQAASPVPDPNVKYPWTPAEVAEQFTAALALAETTLGPHWNVGSDNVLRLGEAWCPVFCRYVPKYGDANPWIGTMIMWLGAIGATKTILGPPLKREAELAKLKELQKRRQASSPASTRTAPFVEASESSASEGQENQRSWSAS